MRVLSAQNVCACICWRQDFFSALFSVTNFLARVKDASVTFKDCFRSCCCWLLQSVEIQQSWQEILTPHSPKGHYCLGLWYRHLFHLQKDSFSSSYVDAILIPTWQGKQSDFTDQLMFLCPTLLPEETPWDWLCPSWKNSKGFAVSGCVSNI